MNNESLAREENAPSTSSEMRKEALSRRHQESLLYSEAKDKLDIGKNLDAAAVYRKLIAANDKASSHIGLGLASMGIAKSSKGKEKEDALIVAITQFENFPLAASNFE